MQYQSVTSLKAAAILSLIYLVYILGLYAYRFFFHPLSKFPGPKLAALSHWYEFYYDVLQHGQFTEHIQELHKLYGPIVRITPTEIHISDPEFYDTLYERSGRRDKYGYFSRRFGYASDSFSTIHHDVHRMRRRALSPFFSVKCISEFQPVIRAKTAKFCNKIAEYHPNFKDTLHDALLTCYITGHFALHFLFVFPILDSLPDWFVIKVQPLLRPMVGIKRDLAQKVRAIRDGTNGGHKSASHATIFHELLHSDLPEPEKTDKRPADEAQLIVAALRAELRSAGVSASDETDWRTLEGLSYLNGCVRKAIRLAHGTSTRSPWLAHDQELHYQDWVIPKNTPVSMTNVDILMNEDIYLEPKEFRPERWIENPVLEKYFVPFTKGSWQCLGLNLAQAELYIVLAMVFIRFDFQLYETDVSDVEMVHAYLIPYSKWESKGVRVLVNSID
ncbi:cytochrome P450 [Microthyrium microscopicum]|uniref:Cytochrome P450 n=1 Tax=Microthyrium microscopicum TaxID=703497 RepID=A0A6A6UGS4_9PEZI|nr:cytochrome P450 [Microthyrium microscopicum]